MRIMIFSLAILLLCSKAHAQIPHISDQETVIVPDLSKSSDPSVVKEGWKYFVFQRHGVTFQEAYADFSDCYRFMQPVGWSVANTDRFIPWNRAPANIPRQRAGYMPNNYGVIGSVILGMAEDVLTRRAYQAKMRACMEPRGYIRYGVAQSIWTGISKLPPEQWVAVQAKIASGPDFGGVVPNK